VTRLLIAGPEPFAARLQQIAVEPCAESEADIQLVGSATNVRQARDLLVQTSPSVLVLDVGGGGLDLLDRLMLHRPLPVIAVTESFEQATQARRLGAVEVIRRPSEDELLPYRRRFRELIRRSSLAVSLDAPPSQQAGPGPGASCSTSLIAIGASTGGPEAVETVLRNLPPDCPGVLVALHIPAQFSRTFAERLDSVCRIRVKEAAHGDWLRDGCALIAPGGLHMRVIRHGRNFLTTLDGGPKVCHQRPSVDVLFDSLVPFTSAPITAVILTGMGQDGAAAMRRLRKAGAWTIAQDEASSVVYGMPGAAAELDAACQILPLDAIAGAVQNSFRRNRPQRIA
jgi:two-component system chemotaxis response regulator CheB